MEQNFSHAFYMTLLVYFSRTFSFPFYFMSKYLKYVTYGSLTAIFCIAAYKFSVVSYNILAQVCKVFQLMTKRKQISVCLVLLVASGLKICSVLLAAYVCSHL